MDDLLLTTSVDWTCKLWNLKASPLQPVHSFDEANDYVYDARWCVLCCTGVCWRGLFPHRLHLFW
jgi:hypothetical protein